MKFAHAMSCSEIPTVARTWVLGEVELIKPIPGLPGVEDDFEDWDI